MSNVDLKGVFPPIATPFLEGRVAYDKLASNVEKWSKTGIRGIVVFGSNGESVFLSEEEKCRVVETVVQSSPKDRPTIVGSGCESTLETLKLTEACAGRGADAALIITPHFYGGKMTEKALINHYTELANRSSLPLLIYNVPKFTHINVTVNLVAILSQHPNIMGIKDSAGNVAQLGEFLNGVHKDFDVLVGTAGVLFGALTLGCAGGILALANVAPEICVRIQDLIHAGRLEEARTLQLKMIPVNKAITATYGIAGLKAALDMLGYFGGDPRPPLLPASGKEKDEIREILTAADLL